MGAWLASPISPLVLMQTVLGLWQTGAGLLLSLLLAYLLTHRPLSTVVSLVTLIAVASVFPNNAFWWGISFSNSGPLFLLVGILETLLMFTGWRVRSWVGLSFIALATLFVASFVGLFFFSLIETGIAVLVGVAVVLLISNLVNHITGVGR
jgi:hypothetical protein